ncbi:hypothetical protein SAMN05421688_2840 [Poseidonocella pacifica]|uniref:Uncharacterized protein n=1 Tax=Poseidonocella pacifica TaxID=871651 RepID=A0A1I0Y5T4_9RHOB|nr:hypothetical protein [Poseidonocella pacifica]SFB08554.1 hypothetical protein SAMN05421688_2840 [Poseidonocella pacifica]
MMISGTMPGMAGHSANPLTTAQNDALSELLTKVDSSNLSDDDAKALVEGIKSAGISKGSGLTQALAEAGIDARSLAEQSGTGGPQGAGGPEGAGRPGGSGGPKGGGQGGPQGAQGKGTEDTSVQLMQSIVDQLSDSSEEENYQEQLLSALEEAGLDLTQSTVDIRF